MDFPSLFDFRENQQVSKLDSGRNPQRRINILLRPAKSGETNKTTAIQPTMPFNAMFNGGSYLFGDDSNSGFVKMEPVSPASSVSSSTNSSYGGRRKRNASQAMSAAEAKKLKKYEMDPTDNPAVKNAIAAKANREKHKQEFQRIKAENIELKSENEANAKKLAAANKEIDQCIKERDQTRRELQRVQDDFSAFMRMVAFGDEQKKAIAQSAIPQTVNTNNVNTTNYVVGLDKWADEELEVHQPGDQIQVLSQGTLDQLLLTDMGHSASFPELSCDEVEDFHDPLMTSNFKDYDLPRTPEDYDLGYRQHDDLDQFENHRARAFTPPGG